MGGFIVAYFLRINSFEFIYVPPLAEFIQYVSYFIPLWVITFALAGLYSPKYIRISRVSTIKVLVAVTTSLMLFVTIMFFIRDAYFSRLIIIYSLLCICTTVIISRFILLWLKRLLHKYGVGVKRVFLIGNNETTAIIAHDLMRHTRRGYELIGIITTDENHNERIDTDLVIGSIDKLGPLVVEHSPDEIIQTDPNMTNEDNINIIHLCEDKNLQFRFVPSLFSLYAKNNTAETFGKIPVFAVHRSPLQGWGRIAKRMLDIVGATFGIILTLPIQILVAIIIKTTSKGPLLIIQERVGRDGNFKLFKFRSMYHADDIDARHAALQKKHGIMFKLRSDQDPRVTPIGRFIRKTSIDEIAQFYNVFIGNMSLVGPRPPMPMEVARYTREQKKRLGAVKPGITGLWQVSGRSDISFDDWVKLDVYYIENWSFTMDLYIIVKTVFVLATRKGAY